ncbi:ATP-grasp enzyme-like protein [endosymbiont of Riftia pachyptila (vent Ph05)]|uniref:ATP-grasp enzyme-like protein n=1 Tax=endosymbiont of Riftia pachyptila (vent Ph05) TaxID=1048808 RepID=G2DCZ4_9GAMM|nr:ATP-grasp enzyme-like protein [endosymbiont of Riftia pachyptila (vent Ph05)]
MSVKNKLTSVVVLDINFAGYGILRSLAPYGIPLIGFYPDASVPEAKTRLCSRKYHFKDDEELLALLTSLPELQSERPVLMLTADAHVTFYIEHRELLDPLYLIDMPDAAMIDLLLDKEKFSAYALEHEILIPKTLVIDKTTDLQQVAASYRFPAILKPSSKSSLWRESGLAKAFHLADAEEFLSVCSMALSYSDSLIVQEWIAGNDSNVHYCLGYFGETGDDIVLFTGYKLRQWPVGTGSTATTVVVDNKWIEEETKKIFKKVGFKGFGSVEFKRHELDGHYYVMEPTAGRLNQQEYVATLNGVNIPLAAYNYITGMEIVAEPPKKLPVIYIDERAEIASTYVHFKRKLLSFAEWRKSLQGNRAYRYWTPKDPVVFFSFVLKHVGDVLRKVVSFIIRR